MVWAVLGAMAAFPFLLFLSLEAYWRVLGVFGDVLGASWVLLGASWGLLGCSWETSRGVLGHLKSVLSASWAILKASPKQPQDKPMKMDRFWLRKWYFELRKIM